MTPAEQIAERRHAELMETLRRIALGIEELNIKTERQSRHIAEVATKAESLLMYAVRLWRGDVAPTRR